MTPREKIAHACRRFAFGATVEELDRYEKAGLDATLKDLLDFEKPSSYPVSPFEFFYQKDAQLQTQPTRVTGWWLTRMVFTDRPNRDKLLVFLHDHFAVSASKVESGPLMLGYLQTLESNLTAPFASLLQAIAVDPAMLLWLDLRESVKGRPNENFARELMELFTLGIGHYTESDVKETARALTGWSIRNVAAERGRDAQRVAFDDWARGGPPLVAAAYSTALWDESPKTILGQTQAFDLAGVCRLMASQPATALYLCRKLWEYYAYPNPEPKVVERLAKAFAKSQGRIPSVFAEMTKMPEFWSDKAVRAIVKSPIDYVIPIFREVLDREAALKDRPERVDPTTPIAAPIQTLANSAAVLCRRMGLLPLYPPDVAGWNWGTDWITSATILDRVNLFRSLTLDSRARPASVRVLKIAQARGISDNDGLVELAIQVFDAPVNDEQRATLRQIAKDAGLGSAASNIDAFNRALAPVVRAIFSMPAFQLC